MSDLRCFCSSTGYVAGLAGGAHAAIEAAGVFGSVADRVLVRCGARFTRERGGAGGEVGK